MIKTASAAALMAVSTFVAQAPQQAFAQTPSGFYVCNESGETLYVTVAYYEGGTWTTKGRQRLDQTPGTCLQMYSSLSNTRFYLYATSDAGRVWQGNHPFCIGFTPNFLIGSAEQTQFCSNYVANFFSVWVPDPVTGRYPQHYAYTFAPNNYSTNWNSPRAER